MKRWFGLSLAISLLTIGIALGEWVTLNNADQPFTVGVTQTGGDRMVLSYQVNAYSTSEIVIQGKTFTLFDKLRKESLIEEAGSPRLPRINRSVVIPDNGTMSYRVLSEKYIEIEGIEIAPSKGHLLRTVDPETVPYTFGEAYQQDAFYPEALVNLRTPYILRDYRGAVVELNAFRYNPVSKTLRIYTDVTIEVYKSASGGENTLARSTGPAKLDPQYFDIYQRHFINFNQLDYPTLFEEGDLLIISYDSYADLLEPLVEWKNQKGVPTTLVPLSQVGTTTDQIYTYIRNVYLTSNLAYVLLVGDSPQIPTYTSGSDPNYSLLAGTDTYPEIFIGRFSAETRAQVETQVERTVDYEMLPQAGAQWYHKGLGVASNQGSGIGHHGEADNVHITQIAHKLLDYTYTQVDSAYDNWGTAAMVSNFLNNGRSIINYCGHGSTTSWGSTGFNNGNVNALVNDNMLPHIVSVACDNGIFVGTTCFAEAWLRATNDVTGEPAGAVGAYMSKHSQSWAPPMDMQDEGVDLMVADSMFTYGGICFNGSMLMIDLNGGTGETEFKYWTIFGDPSLKMRNDIPIPYTVLSNPVHLIGTTSYTVTVTSAAGPVQGAAVCAMNAEIYAVGYTNAAGQVSLNINPVIPGEFTLTITGWNAIPNINTIDIIPPDGPYVVYNNHTVQDDLFGNNNGQWDYGETVELGIYAENVGVNLADNTTAALTTTDTLVTIIDGTADFGDIAAGVTAYIERAFRVEMDEGIENGHISIFTLSITDGIAVWESNFAVTAYAPEAAFVDLEIDDSAGGNGNGNLDPGETAGMIVSLANSGGCQMEGMIGDLSTSDPYITINNGNFAVFGMIPVGFVVPGNFTITVSPACPQEHEVEFTVDITDGAGYAGTVEFVTTVGDLVYAPTGPDAYGYLAYDSNDAPYFPEFAWVEISPDSGGAGTEIFFTSDDQVLYSGLPFNFQYYGADYDTISISSNGFICMGLTNDADYSNSGIPNTDGPGAMLAVYWEDLSPQRPNSGGVWKYYDEANHRFIIEFNHVEQFSPTGSFETFQAILLDPAFYPTSTGDGQIKFQYKDMSATSQTEGTIGIEDAGETVGIEYLYDGDYDIHAAAVDEPMAILFTTSTETPDVTITLTPASLPIVIPAIGGSFNYTVALGNTGVGPASFDAWLDVTMPDSSIYGPVLLRQGITLGAGGTLSRNMTQNVPGAAPAGNYSFNGYVGGYLSGIIFDSDSFPFSKAGVDAGSRFNNWNSEGWDETPGMAVASIPTDFFLNQNYPNPFNPETNIAFGLPVSGMVTLKVYNLLGEEVAALVEGMMPAGYYEFSWQAGDLSSGIYFYRLEARGYSAVKKMMLVR